MTRPARWPAFGVMAALVVTAVTLTPAAKAVAAPPDAEVEALQMPAWLTRDGKRQPLAPGAQLKSGDIITTGEGSRVLLRLAEGSALKLGANARFDVGGMSQTMGCCHRMMFNASFEVRQGAFRFTSPHRGRAMCNVAMRLPTVTASVVGTDIWGKTTNDQETVVLIDGKMNVSHKGEVPVTVSAAKTVYVVPRDGPPRPVTAITLQQLNAYAQETELQPGAGVASTVGKYKVYAARTPSQEEALAVYQRVTDAGYAAAIQPALNSGQQIYQVRIVGILSEADGVAMAVKLRVELGLSDVQVSLN